MTNKALRRESTAPEQNSAEHDKPLLRSERIWGFRRFTGVNINLAIATWAFLQGGAVAHYVGAKEAIASIFIGYGISVLLVALAPAQPSAKYGVEQFVSLRSIFGVRGARVVMWLITVIATTAWSALLAIMVGHALINVGSSLFNLDLSESSSAVVLAGLIAVLSCWGLLVWGPKAVGKVSNLVAPILVVITLAMLVLVFTRISWADLTEIPPLTPIDDSHMAFIIAIEINIAGGLAWWKVLGNLARLTDSPRASFWPNMIGFFFVSSVAAVVGTFAALALGSDDPTVWMVPLGGVVLGVAALGFIAVANITSMVTQAYSGLSAIIGADDRIRRIPWKVLSTLFLAPVAFIALFPEVIYDNYGRFLSWEATVAAGLCGIQFFDYFVMRRTRLNLRDLYRSSATSQYSFWKGYNPVAFIAVAAGAICYTWLLHPIAYEPNELFRYAGASIPAFFVAGVVYWAGSTMIFRRRGIGGYDDVGTTTKQLTPTHTTSDLSHK